MHPYTKVFKPVLVQCAQKYRKERRYSQEQMAELLHMTLRSYNDIERECSCFSAASLIFFFMLLSDAEIQNLMGRLRQAADNAESDVI